MWTLREQTRNPVPGFQLDWLPPAAYNYLTPRVSRATGRIELETGPHIGLIPLMNGASLRILPHSGGRAVGRMLMVTEGLSRAISREFDQLARIGYDVDLDGDWEQLLRRAFVRSLSQIEKKGLRTARVSSSQRLSFVRGRVSITPTLLSIGRQEQVPIHCTFKRKTLATSEHRVLAAAAHLTLRARGSLLSPDRVLVRWASFARGPLARKDLEEVGRRLESGAYTGPRAYYIPALVAARLLLAGGGIAIETERTVLGEAFLINTATLFENYVRKVVSEAFSPLGYVTQKGSSPSQTLFTDGSCELVPDVVVSDKHGPQLILDAKYKPETDLQSSDFYQATVYAEAYRLPGAALVLPNSGVPPTRTDKTTTRGIAIHVLRIPIDDWEATEAWLAEEALRLARETRQAA